MSFTAAPSRPLLEALTGDSEIEDLLSDATGVAAMLAFEGALARAESDVGLISVEAANAIEAALDTFQPDWTGLAEGLSRDGVVIPALVTQLRAHVGAPHADAVHFGATSQDAIDTALVMQLGQVMDRFDHRLAGLLQSLDSLDERFGTQTLMAHTRMQQAMPFTVADKLATWRQPLLSAAAALLALRASVLVVQLGGPVGNRASFRGHGDGIAKLISRRLSLADGPAWHVQRQSLVALASQVSIVSGSLGKIGADVALLAQNEVGAIRLANGGSSSVMAHKSNPVDAEVLVTLARFNAGLVGSAHSALVHENERSGAAWTLEWLVLPRMLVTLGAGLNRAERLLSQIAFVPGGQAA